MGKVAMRIYYRCTPAPWLVGLGGVVQDEALLAGTAPVAGSLWVWDYQVLWSVVTPVVKDQLKWSSNNVSLMYVEMCSSFF